MKKLYLFLTILLFCSALFASTTDVFKTTTEISAYKKLVITDSLYEDIEPIAVTFTVKNSSNSTVENSESLFSSSSFNYNQSYSNAIKWTMTGNQYHAIHVSFKFTPLYSGTFDLAGNMIVSDPREVIPYTVTFSSYTNNKTSIMIENWTLLS